MIISLGYELCLSRDQGKQKNLEKTMRFNVRRVIKHCNMRVEIKEKTWKYLSIGSVNINVFSNISDAFGANHC